MYSAATESRLIASVAQIAIRIDARAISEMANGPRSLQRRSMRRIRAFKTESLGHQGAGKMLRDAWACSLEEQRWTQIRTRGGDSPNGRGWFDADVVNVDGNDGIVVVEGLGESNDCLDDAWLLTFSDEV